MIFLIVCINTTIFSDEDAAEPGYKPAWFSWSKDQVSGKMTHIYNGEYWECKRKQDWSRCPDIY